MRLTAIILPCERGSLVAASSRWGQVFKIEVKLNIKVGILVDLHVLVDYFMWPRNYSAAASHSCSQRLYKKASVQLTSNIYLLS